MTLSNLRIESIRMNEFPNVPIIQICIYQDFAMIVLCDRILTHLLLKTHLHLSKSELFFVTKGDVIKTHEILISVSE